MGMGYNKTVRIRRETWHFEHDTLVPIYELGDDWHWFLIDKFHWQDIQENDLFTWNARRWRVLRYDECEQKLNVKGFSGKDFAGILAEEIF